MGNRGPGSDRSAPALTATEAQLYVSDIRISCAFYTTRLGFSVSFVHGDPPGYAQVIRDQARLNLRAVDGPVFAGDIREREQLLSATLTVASSSELEELYSHYRAADVRFSQEMRSEPWGARTFIVEDPDGNLILFAGPD